MRRPVAARADDLTAAPTISGGVERSGGQWRRIALALMRQGADILILDEPTAALDIDAAGLARAVWRLSRSVKVVPRPVANLSGPMHHAAALMSLLIFACGPGPSAPEPVKAALAGPPVTTAPVAGDERFTGRVLERLSARPYTYLHVATDAGPRWVVTMGAAPPVDAVEVRNMGTQRNFHARRLGRDFDELVFGIVAAAPPLTEKS